MYEKFGFKTRNRLTVLKAYENDAATLCKLCSKKHNNKKAVEEWRVLLKKAEDDFFEDVTYLIRDKCGKTFGMIETVAKENNSIEIAIWIPDKDKREKYLQEVVDSFCEWCEEEEYDSIKLMYSVEGLKDYKPIMENVQLCSAS